MPYVPACVTCAPLQDVPTIVTCAAFLYVPTCVTCAALPYIPMCVTCAALSFVPRVLHGAALAYVPTFVTWAVLVAHRRSVALPRCRTSQCHKTFVLFSVSLWNDVDDPVLDGVGLADFKSRVNAFFLALTLIRS